MGVFDDKNTYLANNLRSIIYKLSGLMQNYENNGCLAESQTSLIEQLQEIRDLTLQQLNYQMAINQMFFQSHQPAQGPTHVFNN